MTLLLDAEKWHTSVSVWRMYIFIIIIAIRRSFITHRKSKRIIIKRDMEIAYKVEAILVVVLFIVSCGEARVLSTAKCVYKLIKNLNKGKCRSNPYLLFPRTNWTSLSLSTDNVYPLVFTREKNAPVNNKSYSSLSL